MEQLIDELIPRREAISAGDEEDAFRAQWQQEREKEAFNEKDTHFSRLFTDDNYYQAAKEQNYALAEALDPEATAKRSLINAYLEHQLGREIPSANYEPERDAFAMANYGKKNLDDSQLFEAIRGTYDFQRQRTEAINDLHVQAVGKALADTNLGVNRPFVEGMTGVFNEWQQKYPELVDGKEDAAYLAQAYKLYYDTINDLDAVRPIAGKTLSTLDAFTKGNASGEDLQSLAQTLAQATPEDRDKVYKYVTLGAQAGQIDRAGIEQFAINLGQSFSRGFDFIPQGSLQQMESGVESFLNGIRNGSQVWVPSSGDLTKAVVGNASPDAAAQAAQEGAWRQASVGETETLIASANDAMQTFQVVRELRNVAKTGVDPIRPVMEKGSVMGAVEGGAYGVAGSIGFLGATAINPFLGVAAYQANEYDRIMLENKGMDIRAAQGLALVEGTWQAALDRVQLATLSGKLPVLGRFLGNIENNGVRRTLKVGASVAEQFGQELAQDTGTIVIDNIAAALREDMPDKDFAAEMAKYGEQIPETLAASVMFGLVGGGFATAADLGVTEQQMKIVGINDQKIARIKQATSPEEADTLIQSALESRTAEDIEAGKTYARQVFNEAQNPPPESPRISLVTGQDGTDEYLVTAPDGSEMLRTKSQQAAMEAVTQHGHAQLLNRQLEAKYEPEELRQIINDRITNWKSQDSNNTVVMESEGMNAQQKLEQLQAAGNAAQIQELHNRIANSHLKDTPYDQINILGEASVDDVAEMVFKPLITINPNTRPENLREEIHHTAVKVALKNGSVTLDTLRGWLDATEKALPDTFPNLVRDTEGDIVESLAQVQAAYEDGKIDANEASNLPASFIDYIKNMMRTFAEVLRRAVALRGAFKDGALPAEYESFLAESVGLNQQTMVDTTRERASGDIITDGGQMLMDFSIGSRSNAVSTDTPSIRASNATITGPANYSIAAHHGTPHKVDKFSTEKIGTGEGAQAYGWGLYFAENRKVADDYKKTLSSKNPNAVTRFLYDGAELPPVAKTWEDQDPKSFAIRSLQNVAAGLSEDGKAEVAIKAVRRAFPDAPLSFEDAVAEEARNANPNAVENQKGNIYTVELDVEPEDLLDWDKPLSEQSEKVRRAMESLKLALVDTKELQTLWDTETSKGFSYRGSAIVWNNDGYVSNQGKFQTLEETLKTIDNFRKTVSVGDMTGAEAYQRGRSNLGMTPKEVSSAMLKAGIPGIRYLDGGSRSVNATDERLLELAEKNNGNKEAAVDEFMRSVYDAPKAKEKMRSDLLRNFPERTSNYVVFDENLIKITEENGNRIPASQALAQPVSTDTNYSIGKKDKEVVVNPDETTEPGTPAPDTGIEILDPDQEGEDIPWGPTNYSIGPRSLPEVFPTIDKKLFNKIKKETSTIAAIHIDRMKVGELMGIPLQGGMFYPSIVENLKAGVVWAFNAPNVARTVARRAAANGGYVKLVLMQEGNVIGNKTFTHVWFANLEQNISSGAITKATALGELNRVRELFANHSDSKLSTGHKKKWQSLEEAKDAIISLPQQKRASTYFKKTKVETKGEGVKIAYQQLLSKKNTKLGMPDPITLVEQMEEPAFKGMPTGAIVGIIKIDPIKDSDPILTGQQAGVPTHLSYDYVLKGKPVAKMKKITVLDEAFPETKNQILTQQHTDFPLAGAINYSIASQSEIDRVNKALGGMNRGPDERLKVYERAREMFLRVMQQNKEELDAIRSAVSTNTAPAVEQVESERASKLADLTTEEATEVAKALQDNADTFMPRIEAAQTLAERKRVERDAKDRAKILEKGIRDKYAERKAAIDTEAKTQRQQIEQAAAAKDSAANARMRDKVRHTKLVTAIGELDGILKVLPPEVRGRVGGFAVLANIGTGDKALADFFVKRIDMIDRQLERTLKEEYGSAFDALLERTKPKKAAAGEKPKGIGADIQSLFAVVREARNWNAEKVDGHIASIETQIASGNLSAQDEAMLTREADLVSLAGDWKNADSSRRAAALESAKETWDKGMSEFIQKKIREREDRDISRAEAISATGKKGDYVDRRKKDKADNGIKGDGKGWFMDTLAWDGVVNIFFGHESPMAIRLSDGQRKAEYAKIDAVAAKEEAIHDLFTKLAGGKRADGEKLLWQMSQPSIPANGLDLSEMEALSATMLWMQEDGRRHMEGKLNENGIPVSKWHYDQKFIDEIESALSPEAKAVRDYLLDAYAKEWFAINSVYRELNGVNLPQIKNYSPVTVRPMNAPSGMVTDPVTGHAISATSISPGALRTRGTAIAEPAFRNVVQTYIAHTRQMEHWKAFAPWIKEANGILRFRDVQDSIHEAGGEEAIRVLNKFLDAFAQGGNRDASLGLKISEVLNRMASRAAQVALIGRVGTLAIQTTQIGAASAELPMGAYVYRLGKLLTGNLGWGDSLNSAYIQRRLKQMPPIVQIAMEGLKAGKPNQLKHQIEKIGRLIAGSDALWTAGTYAMVYDYNLGQAKSLGYTGKAAEDYAHNTAERITDRLAQPTRMGAKSIYEVTATNPGSRLGWAFASEARKNIALLAYTKANRPLKRFGATALGFIVFNLAMGAFIRNAWKDIRDDGDDEDEFFDSKTWNWKRIGVAMATEPLQGIPYLGDYIEKGINTALGQYHQSSDLINFERGVRAIKHIPDIVQGEREMADVLKDIDGMVSLMGLFNQNAAAAASLTHIASDFFGIADNATSD